MVKFDDDDDTLATGVDKLPIVGHTLPSRGKPNDDKDDWVEQFFNNAPKAQEIMKQMYKWSSNRKLFSVTIKGNADGKIEMEELAKEKPWDISEAHIIAQPKSDVDAKLKTESFCDQFLFIKEKKCPSGVCYDVTQITLSLKKDYQLGQDFERTKRVLGRGNSGEICVVKDIPTGKEHAVKIMILAGFNPNEILCWYKMNDTNFVPRLLLTQIEGNKVYIHMEIVENAKTLRSIIDDHLDAFPSSLLWPFSLFVLDRLLEALSAMNTNGGWLHKDLHAGNAMIQKTSEKMLAVKVIDFGRASQFKSKNGVLDKSGFTADISEVLRIVCALYSGLEFNNAYDIQTNWKKKIIDMSKLEVDKKDKLLCLVEAAMRLDHPDDLQEYRNLVKEKLNDAMGDQQEGITQECVSLFFTEEYGHGHTDMDNADNGHGVVDCPGVQQVSKDSVSSNRANTTDNRGGEAFATLMKQLTSSRVQPE